MNADPAGQRRHRFEALAAEVYEPIQRYVRRRVDRDAVDDVVADAMLTLWRRLDDVPVDAVLPWAYGVTRRHVSNHRRSLGRYLRLVGAVAAQPAPAPVADTPVDPELHTALAALGDTDREVLRLWAWEALEPSEIAVTLGITPNAATVRLHRAKRRLAEKLGTESKTGATRGHSHWDSSKEKPS